MIEEVGPAAIPYFRMAAIISCAEEDRAGEDSLAVEELSSVVGVKRACQDLSVPRSGIYRRRQRRLSLPPVDGPRSSARRLKDEEKSAVLACLHEDRYQDCSPSQVYASPARCRSVSLLHPYHVPAAGIGGREP
jgi:hypothetical protein